MEIKHTLTNGKHIFIWPVKPLDSRKIDECFNELIAVAIFSCETPEAKVLIAQTAKKYDLGEEVVYGTLSQAIRNNTFRRTAKINERLGKIIADYAAGRDIIELAKRHHYSPILLLKKIFDQKYSRADSKLIIAGKMANINQRDLEQLVAAAAVDQESAGTVGAISGIVAKNENILAGFFRRLDIPVKTESDLRVDGGAGVSTPDLLFDTPITINDVEIRWIDFKNYLGIPRSFFAENIRRQVIRTSAERGPGAICFKPGFCDTMRIPALLLDTEPIKNLFV